MRIMTYNIQSGRDAYGALDITKCEETIRNANSDVVALNEVRMRTLDVDGMEQAAYLAKSLGMHYYFSKAIDYNGGDYGIALLSKYEILSAASYPVPQVFPVEAREKRYEDRVVLNARLKAGDKIVSAYVSHFGLSNAERENAAELVIDLLKQEKGPAIFMGDLNMTPDDPLILKIREYVKDLSENETYMTHHTLDLKDRIDYIFASAHFSLKSIHAPFSTASDHLPLVADVDFNA